MPLFYDCQRCSACCRWPGEVPVNEAEVARLAAFLGLTEFDFIQRYTRLTGDRRGLALAENDRSECVFLEGSDCRIQAVKPQQCRDFPNLWNHPGWDHQCQAVPRQVNVTDYQRLMAAATGRPLTFAAPLLPVDCLGNEPGKEKVASRVYPLPLSRTDHE